MTIRFITKADGAEVQDIMRGYTGDWISDTEYIIDYIDNHDFYALGKFAGDGKLLSFILVREVPEQKFAVLHLFFARPYNTIYQHQIHKVYDEILKNLQIAGIYRYYTVLKANEAKWHHQMWSTVSKERVKYDVYMEERIPAYEFSLFNQYQNNMLNGKLKSECSEIYHYVLREEFRK